MKRQDAFSTMAGGNEQTSVLENELIGLLDKEKDEISKDEGVLAEQRGAIGYSEDLPCMERWFILSEHRRSIALTSK